MSRLRSDGCKNSRWTPRSSGGAFGTSSLHWGAFWRLNWTGCQKRSTVKENSFVVYIPSIQGRASCGVG